MRKVARANGDPLADRQKLRRIVPTFEDAAREVHKAHSPSFRNVKHREQWINTLIAYVFPVFGTRQVDRVEPADILKALSPIWLVNPETARRVRQRIKSVFDWAKAAGFRSGDNPVEGVSKALPKQRDDVNHHASLPYGDVPKFLTAVRGATMEASVKLAFEFLILTSTRTSEVLGARWDEFNLKEKTWTIPADRMKAHRIHRVPLPAIIKITPDGNAFCPQGRAPKSRTGRAARLVAIDANSYFALLFRTFTTRSLDERRPNKTRSLKGGATNENGRPLPVYDSMQRC
jgi:integrase